MVNKFVKHGGRVCDEEEAEQSLRRREVIDLAWFVKTGNWKVGGMALLVPSPLPPTGSAAYVYAWFWMECDDSILYSM